MKVNFVIKLNPSFQLSLFIALHFALRFELWLDIAGSPLGLAECGGQHKLGCQGGELGSCLGTVWDSSGVSTEFREALCHTLSHQVGSGSGVRYCSILIDCDMICGQAYVISDISKSF